MKKRDTSDIIAIVIKCIIAILGILDLAYIITVIILKLYSVISWEWYLVLLPLEITAIMNLVTLVLYLVLVYLTRPDNGKIRR